MSRTARRGYTVIEVLMAISILAIGATGVIALQKTTVMANLDARRLNTASEIATSWVERLRAEATLWNHPSPLQSAEDIQTDTLWLKQGLYGPSAGKWFAPESQSSPVVSSMANVLGRDVDPLDQPEARFCTNLRMTRILPGVVRAEVRVHWPRDQSDGPLDPGLCLEDPELVGPEVERYHFVYLATGLQQNIAY